MGVGQMGGGRGGEVEKWKGGKVKHAGEMEGFACKLSPGVVTAI